MGIEQRHEGAPLQIPEASAAIDPRFRCLTEVDNLFANRLPDGTYPAESLASSSGWVKQPWMQLTSL
jgi:hypothetical protein